MLLDFKKMASKVCRKTLEDLNSIIGNFVAYQDRLETNLLQSFGNPENSE